MSPPSPNEDVQELRERLTRAETELSLFIERYERDCERNPANSKELQELLMVVRIFGIRWIIIAAVLFYLVWPTLSHKITEVLGLLNK